MPNRCLYIETDIFQAIQLSISTYVQNLKKVPFQRIQFSIQNSSISNNSV